MSESAKAVVRDFLAATDAQRFDRYDELLAADVVAHFPGGVDMNRAEVEAAERAFAVAFPDVTREILDLFSEGDRVVARTAIWGTHRGEFNGIAPTDRAVQTSGPALVQASYLRAGVLQRLRRVAPAGPTSSAAGS